ncbi:restriction endonuclease subunit S [Maribacter sp. Hel_I_7]|uniref:restriction endonuclease subunit S n=1 Tax=Maribacter sp. Hel_I_7 TaxID=1249997 RepID=UPI000479A162|nr:restriction endonuclease subunit S [Maribacter sp. Hel_I_7]
MAEDTNINVIASEERAKQSVSLEHATDRLPRSARNDESKTQPLIPKLRFKEFAGDWSTEFFGKYVLHSAFGPRFSSGLYQRDGGIATLRTTDMDLDGNISYETMPFARLTVDEVKDHILEQNDIVISRSGTIGITGIFKDFRAPVVPGAFLIRFRIDTKSVSSNFIKQNFNSPLGRHKLNALSAGGVQKNLTGTSVKKAEVNFPSLPEQQKIASFLSAVDEKIQQLTQKKSLLEQYKKGVMQQLFSGELRFKDENGEDFPDWEEKRLGGMLKMVVDNRGKTPPIEDEGYPMIEINAVGSRGIKFSVISKFVSQNTFDTWFRKYLESGDILFSTVGATAICSIYTGEKQAVIAQNLVGLRFKIEDSEFMFYLLTEARNNHKFKRIEMGAVQPSVKVSQMVDIKFNVPCLEEQQKIANYLSALDAKIEIVNQQISKTQEFKKGLLQQMFV